VTNSDRSCEACGAADPGGTICRPCSRNLAVALDSAAGLLRDLETNLARQATRKNPGPVLPQAPLRLGTAEVTTLTSTGIEDFTETASGLGFTPGPGGWWDPEAVAATAEALGYPYVREIVLHAELTASEQSSPLDTAALDARTGLALAVRHWSRALASDTGTDPGRDPARWLAARVQLVRQRPWAGEAHREVLRAVGVAVRVVDVEQPESTVGPCPSCGRALTAQRGAVVVECRGCRTTVDVVTARDARLREAEDRMLTARQIAAAMTTGLRSVTPAMIRGWVSRDARSGGGLRPAGYNAAGQPIYRLGDVIVRWGRAQGVSVGEGSSGND